jgi:hypothetical protein
MEAAEATPSPLSPAPVDHTRVYAAVGALSFTLIAGLLPYAPAIPLFVVGLGLSFFTVHRAFPAMWLYGVWLASLYALAFLGATVFALTASVHSPLVGPVPLYAAAAIVPELMALYIALALFAEIKSIRDFRTRLSIARGDGEPEYARIGLWTLALIAFFVLANLSALFFVAWAHGAPTIAVHAALEAMLIGLGVFLLYVPEIAFGKMPKEYKEAVKEPEREGLLTRLVQPRARTETAASAARASDRCPVCAGALDFEERHCPSCAAATRVGWCPKSEVHVVDCEHCGRPVVYGKPVCPHCRGELKEAVLCKSCKVHAPLRDWKGAGA